MDIGKSDSDEQWYWSKKGSGQQSGPVSPERLEELAEEGTLKSEDLVWTKGMNDWQKASSIESLEGLFISPPSLPYDSNDEEEGQLPTHPQGELDDDYKATKSEAISCVHDYDKNDVCRKCGWSKRELIIIGGESRGGEESERLSEESTSTSSSVRSGSGQDASGSDDRYWYNKKRWAIPFFWALLPAILWNGYEKYLSGRNEWEWFEGYVPLVLQVAWFPPVGWYGLSKTDLVTGGTKVAGFLASPFLYFLTMYGLAFPFALNDAIEFKNDRENIISSIVESDSLSKSIDKADRYASALSLVGQEDERLSSVYDSLKKVRSRRQGSSGSSATSASSTSGSDGEKVHSGGECADISGVYTGSYWEYGGGYETRGDGRFEIEDNCEYEWYSSTSIGQQYGQERYDGGPRTGEGVLKRVSDNRIKFGYEGGGMGLDGVYAYDAYVENDWWSEKKQLTWEEEVELQGATLTEWEFDLERTSE